MDLGARAIQAIVKMDTYYEKNLEIYQSIRTFLIAKHMKGEKKKYLERCLGIWIESGLTKNLKRDSPPNYIMKLEERGGKDGFFHYDSLQNYIEANTMVQALSIDQLDYLFRIYFALITTILFVALVQHCVVQLIVRQIQIWLLLFL